MLPQLNVTPKYEFLVPSLNKMVKFRPYLVKEQKVLLIALQEQKTNGIVNAMITAVESCIEDSSIKVRELPMFDIKYLFLMLRTKSVGESSDLIVKCNKCEADNDYSIDIPSITLEVPEREPEYFNIQLDEGIVMKMKYPTAEDISLMASGNFSDMGDFEKMVSIMKSACVHIETVGQGVELVSNVSLQDFTEWVDKMSTDQFDMVKDFVESIPDIKHDIVFDCVSCGENNVIKLSGTDDFFS